MEYNLKIIYSLQEKKSILFKEKINLEREEQKSSVKHGNVRFNLSSPFIIS